MALRVWLPLNGNLENKGLSPAMVEAVTTPVYTDGKIGKCLSEGKIKIPAEYVGDIFNNEHMSICFWYNNNTDSTSGNHAICGFSGNGEGDTDAVRIWDFFNYSTPNNFHWSMGTLGGGSLSNVFPANTWVHIAVTFDGSKIHIYINGVEQANNNASSAYTFNKSYYISFGRTPQKLNDFRIYDECLSPKQIKEISKGLIAHYKLDGPKANENLILRSDKVTSGGQASGITRTYMDDGTLKVVSISGNGNYCSVGFAENSNTNVGNKLSVGNTYTISCDIKVEEGTTFPTLFINSGNGYRQLGGPTLKLNTWQRVYYTNTWNEPGTSYGNIALHIGFSSAIGIYYFKNFKLEKGNFTPWIPAPTDPMYTLRGYDRDICTDCSGNLYNLTKAGTETFNLDSARYGGSTIFGGTCADYLYRDRFTWLTSPFTFNCWIYQTSATSTSGSSTGNTLQFIMSQGRDCGYAGFAICSANGYARLYLGTATSGTYYTINDSTINLLNGWHMLTGTFDGTTAKLYVDGVQKATKDSAVDPSWEQTTCFALGKMSYNATSSTTTYFPFVGSISDAKIYATALSAEDILTMYKNSGIIDNKGNVYAYELCEYNKNFSYPSSIVGATTLGNGVYQVSHSGAYDGAYLPITNFIVGQKYKLTYYFQKIDGILNWMGGHCTGYTISKYYLDGKEISYGYASNTSTVDYLNDEKVHFAEIYFTCNGGTTNDSFYIQPNRGIATAVEVKLFDIKFYGTDFPESEKFKITKNGLNVSYNFLEKEEKASITYNNNIKANSFIEI